MRSLATFVLFTVAIGCAHGRQSLGNCTKEDYMMKMQPCQTNFIHSLQKNPHSDCSVELNTLIDCVSKAFQSCYSAQVSKLMMKMILSQMITKDMFCDKAGLTIPVVASNATLPCDMTVSEYIDAINSCTANVYNMWTANRADKRVCGEYAKAKKCMQKVIDDNKCIQKGDFLDSIKMSLGKYNPFCPNGEDPKQVIGAAVKVFQTKTVFLIVSIGLLIDALF